MKSTKHFVSGILNDIMEKYLLQRHVNTDSVTHVVAALIEASLRGVDSHGINLYPHYCRAVDAGRINKNPEMKIIRRHRSAILLDADHGFGHHAGSMAIQIAIEKAHETGIGAVCVRNSSHFAAAAYYGLQAAREGYMAFSFTNADALVKAFGSRTVYFGTNPICFTAPMKNEEPFCLDMATSQVSWNKVQNYKRTNQTIPDDWGFSESGSSTTDPKAVTSLNPIGHYKGFGLGMMVEILCALLAGGPFGPDLLPMFTNLSEKRYISHFFLVIDIRSFIDLTSFIDSLSRMAEEVRRLPPLKGVPGVMVPGDPEKQIYKERKSNGIPIHQTTYEDLLSITEEFAQALKP